MLIYFATFGCKVNSSEDEFFLSKALEYGYLVAQTPEEADVIVVNGCAVTQTAFTNVKNFISKITAKVPQAQIILTGCAAPEIEKSTDNSGTLQIIPNANKNNVISSLASIAGIDLSNKYDSPFCGGIPNQKGGHTRAFFKIQDGCDANCSYCIIPSLRGSPISKPIDKTLDELKKCIENGFREIVLVGIHIGLYGKEFNYSLKDLLKRIVLLDGDFRIRLSSIEVNEIDDELLEIMTKNNKICNHLHIPLQSGSEKILNAMNRKYNPQKYVDTVLKAKKIITDLTVGSDVIVGFPSESSDDFALTINTIKEAGTDFLHVFPYSDRQGTIASVMAGKISEKEKELRSKTLRTIASQLLLDRQRKTIGKTLRILTEKNNKGHSDNYFLTEIDEPKPLQKNMFMNVIITKADDKKLIGTLVDS